MAAMQDEPTAIEAASSSSDEPARPRFQFSLRTLLLLPVVVAFTCGLLCSPPIFALFGLLLTAPVLPAMLTIVIIYDKGWRRTFCIGAIFPVGFLSMWILPCLSSGGFVPLTPGSTEPVRYLFGIVWLLAILTGLLAQGLRWLLERTDGPSSQ